MKKSVLLILFFPLFGLSETEFQGLEWLEKYRDAKGCIALGRLINSEVKVKECPKEFSPQIRPKMIGTLRNPDTKNALCCYDWKTLGNR